MAEGAIVAGVVGGGAAIYEGISANQSAQQQAEAIARQNQFQKELTEFNKDFAKSQASDAIKRGEEAVQVVKQRAKSIVGSQRAGLAAQGVDISSGAALKIQTDTQILSAVDAVKIRNNAWREAYGYKVQALEYSMRSIAAQDAANNQINSTLAAGGIQAISGVAQGVSGVASSAYNYWGST
jgi:hypothetical protein